MRVLVRQTHNPLYQRKLRRLCSGNSFGTRYRLCNAATEGLFNTAVTCFYPNYPSGLACWRNPPPPSLTSTCYIYSLFPDRVSSFSFILPELPLSSPMNLGAPSSSIVHLGEKATSVTEPLQPGKPKADYRMTQKII